MIGLPGAGKSTVAPLLARRLGFRSVDLDQVVERLEGRSVASILEEDGEERFRDLESRALARVLDEAEPVVLACGGGILGALANRQLLKSRARVVWLEVDAATAAERLGVEGAEARPLLRGEPLAARLRALLLRRAAAYAEAADLVVETDRTAPEEVADRIAARLPARGVPWDSSAS